MSKALVNIWERRRTSPPPAVTRAMRLGPLSAGVVDREIRELAALGQRGEP